MQATDTPEQYLREAYLGEIGGEATFLALIDSITEKGNELRLLAQVENVTAEYLKPYLYSPIPEEEVASRRSAVRSGSALWV